MVRIITIGLICFSLGQLALADAGVEQRSVYKKGYDTAAVEGEGMVNAPVKKVLATVLDHDSAPKWIPEVSELKSLKVISPTERIQRSKIDMPFPLTDRVFYVRVHLEANKYGGIDIVSKSTPWNSKDEDAVIGTIHSGLIRLIPIYRGKKTLVQVKFHADPNGYLPSWIVNYFQVDWPTEYIRGLRTQVKRSTFQIPQSVESFLLKSLAH